MLESVKRKAITMGLMNCVCTGIRREYEQKKNEKRIQNRIPIWCSIKTRNIDRFSSLFIFSSSFFFFALLNISEMHITHESCLTVCRCVCVCICFGAHESYKYIDKICRHLVHTHINGESYTYA